MLSGSLSFDHHPRQGGRYVYAVLSRRAGGISVGVNLNPDKICNFDCVYCQVDRDERGRGPVVPEALERELSDVLADVTAGGVSRRARAGGLPAALARVSELAIAGDGEPTLAPNFSDLARIIVRVAGSVAPELPLTLFTNATTFHRERVREGLDALATVGARVLAKLDAGTASVFSSIDRGKVSYERVLSNLGEYAAHRPLWIQSMFIARDGQAPLDAELEAYVAQLTRVWDAGHLVQGVEIATTARRPAEPTVGALSLPQLESIAMRVRSAIPDVPVQIVPAVPGESPAV